MKKLYFFVIILLLVWLTGCTANQTLPAASQPIDEKHYCETEGDCVDGSYCEKTDTGCVGDKWWQNNVGYKYDCLPDPSACLCKNNECVKK